MGFRAILAFAAAAILLLAWHRLRDESWRGGIPATFGLLMLPGLLLAAADAYALYLLAHGCATTGAWRVAGLGALGLANAGLVASVVRAARHARRATRMVRALPELDATEAARLKAALPALAGVNLRVAPVDTPVLFTTGTRHPAIVLSRWVLSHLDEEELIAALAHELGHIAHRDGRWLLLVHALCPGGLGLFREPFRHLAAAMEQRADAWAAARTADRLALASALVKVSRHAAPSPAAAPAFAGHASAVRARVAMIVHAAPVRPTAAAGWTVAAFGLGALTMAMMAVGSLCGVSAG